MDQDMKEHVHMHTNRGLQTTSFFSSDFKETDEWGTMAHYQWLTVCSMTRACCISPKDSQPGLLSLGPQLQCSVFTFSWLIPRKRAIQLLAVHTNSHSWLFCIERYVQVYNHCTCLLCLWICHHNYEISDHLEMITRVVTNNIFSVRLSPWRYSLEINNVSYMNQL